MHTKLNNSKGKKLQSNLYYHIFVDWKSTMFFKIWTCKLIGLLLFEILSSNLQFGLFLVNLYMLQSVIASLNELVPRTTTTIALHSLLIKSAKGVSKWLLVKDANSKLCGSMFERAKKSDVFNFRKSSTISWVLN